MGFFSNLDIEIRNAETLQNLTEMLKKYKIEEGCDLFSQCVEAWNKYKDQDKEVESSNTPPTPEEPDTAPPPEAPETPEY